MEILVWCISYMWISAIYNPPPIFVINKTSAEAQLRKSYIKSLKMTILRVPEY